MTRIFSPAFPLRTLQDNRFALPIPRAHNALPSFALLNLPLFSRAHYSKHVSAGRQSRLYLTLRLHLTTEEKKIPYNTVLRMSFVLSSIKHHHGDYHTVPIAPHGAFSPFAQRFGQMISIFFRLSIRIADYSIAHSTKFIFIPLCLGPNNPEVPCNLSGIAATSKITNLASLRIVWPLPQNHSRVQSAMQWRIGAAWMKSVCVKEGGKKSPTPPHCNHHVFLRRARHR